MSDNNSITIFTSPDKPSTIEPRSRALLMTCRQCLIMILGAVEDYLELERSITPRRKRDAA